MRIENIETKSKEHLIREVARQAAREAVDEAFAAIGVNRGQLRQFQADLIYLQKLRTTSEFISMRIKSVAIAVIIPAILLLVWEAMKA